MFELLCNILLFVFLGYTYFTHVLEAKVPKSYLKNPNVMHPSVWPKMIIILLHIAFSGLLGVNLPRGTVPFLRSFSLFLENLF